MQLVLNDPVVALAGDRFVIRDETNRRTLGGGVVLNPLGRRVRKPLEAYRANLGARKIRPRRRHRSADRFAGELRRQPRPARDARTPPRRGRRCAHGSPLRQALARRRGGHSRRGASGTSSNTSRSTRSRRIIRREPLSPGLEMEALRKRLPYEVGARAFRPMVDRLSHESEIVREESMLRLKSHRVQLGGDAETLGTRVAAALETRRIPAARSQATGRVAENSAPANCRT